MIASNSGGRDWKTHYDEGIDLVCKGPARDTFKAGTSGGGSIDDSNELEDDGVGAAGIHATIFGVTLSNERNQEHSNAKCTNQAWEGWCRTFDPRR